MRSARLATAASPTSTLGGGAVNVRLARTRPSERRLHPARSGGSSGNQLPMPVPATVALNAPFSERFAGRVFLLGRSAYGVPAKLLAGFGLSLPVSKSSRMRMLLFRRRLPLEKT